LGVSCLSIFIVGDQLAPNKGKRKMEESDRVKESNSQKDSGTETEEGKALRAFLLHDPLPGLPFGVRVVTSKGTYVKGSFQRNI
jgi:hypothetical protein